MDFSLSTILIIVFVFCYFAFGLIGAARFADNKLGRFFSDPKKTWMKVVFIILGAFVFAYIEFARIIITGIIQAGSAFDQRLVKLYEDNRRCM